MRLEYLLEQKLVPAGAKILDWEGLEVVELSALASGKKAYHSEMVVVLDGATWIAKGRMRNGVAPYLSGSDEGKEFAVHSRDRFMPKTVEVGEDGKTFVKPGATIDLTGFLGKVEKTSEKKEDTTMTKEDQMRELEAALNEAGFGNDGGAEYSTQFAEEPRGAEPVGVKEKAPTLAQTFSQQIQHMGKTKLPNADRLRAFMRKHSRHVGFVTTNDAQLVMSVKKVRKLGPDNQPVVKDDPEALSKAEDYRKLGKQLPMSVCVTQDTLFPKQKAPGKILAAVVKVPNGGMVPYSSFRLDDGSGVVSFNEQDTSMVTMLLPIADYFAFLNAYLGNTIQEDKATYGEHASKLQIVYRAVRVKGKDASVGIETIAAKPVPTVEGKRAVIMPNAYLPINVFKTLPYAAIRKQEEVDLANNSLLGAYVRGANAFNKVSADTLVNAYDPKYNNLVPDQKAKIRVELRDDTAAVVSPWFTTNGQPEPMQVNSFWSKEVTLTDLEIPIKEVVTKKDGTGARWVLQRVSAVAKELTEEERKMSSLESPKFKAFRDAAGEAVAEDKLKTLSTRSAGAGKNSNYLSAADLATLYFGDVSSTYLQNVNPDIAGENLTARFEMFQ